MPRYIDAEALIDDLANGLWGKDWDKALAEAIVRDAPTIETIYGYRIEHLAFIASIMEKEGVTAECVVKTFGDIGRAVKMIVEETQEVVNAIHLELCPNCGAKMEGDENEGICNPAELR